MVGLLQCSKELGRSQEARVPGLGQPTRLKNRMLSPKGFLCLLKGVINIYNVSNLFRGNENRSVTPCTPVTQDAVP